MTEPSTTPAKARPYRLATVATHAAIAQDPGVVRPLVQPLYQSAVYAFESADQVDAVYEGKEIGHVYYRMGTPNTTALEASVANLEGGEAAVAAASGMGIISAVLFSLTRSGDHVVADRHAYGGTYTLLKHELPRFGIDVSFVDVGDLDGVRAAIRPTTRALLVETLTNPTLRVSDVERLCAIARLTGVASIVDSTFTTPFLIRPLELGADLVWHSLAKYLGGHTVGMGGIAAGRADLVALAREKVVHFGSNLGPFEAWLVGHGLPTLSVRMTAHCANALVVAGFLDESPAVARVVYPGLSKHRDHALASRLFSGRFGGMVSFSLHGGRAAAEAFLRSVELIAFAPSLADVTTTVSYPIATSHRGLPQTTLDEIEVDPGLLRLSVGIEDPRDILVDLQAGLDAARRAAG
jgi:cystathionine beta-lyase/cystathionine gamma-synthase